MYLSSERFIKEFIDVIQHNKLVRFRKRYRQIYVLLIDDTEFLAGKERSQEEFFHTLSTLADCRKRHAAERGEHPFYTRIEARTFDKGSGVSQPVAEITTAGAGSRHLP